MKYKNWKINSFYPKDPLGEILKQRGIKDREKFIDCKYEALSSPGLIFDLDRASRIIKEQIKLGNKIAIFMDYDADGICGGAIVYKTLTKLGANVIYHVPQRKEGYGLSVEAVKKFHALGANLMITIDCGIKNVDEIKLAKSLGIGTIVVDHHELGSKLPGSIANVHPHLSKSGEFRQYSGGGVAFMLAAKLLNQTGQEKWLMDLAAISTIADLVPLVGDNRVIVQYGLIVLNKTRNVGLQQLIKVSLKDPKLVGTYEVGYMIAPRINAAGRIKSPDESFKLLISDDLAQTEKLALDLNKINQRRQEMLSAATQEAVQAVEKDKLDKNKIIVLRGDWNEGIVGLVASKIVEKFYRPTIVFSQSDEKLKGSARSVKGVDITKLIEKCKTNVLNYGGHKQAAGLSVSLNKYKKFKAAIEFEADKISDSVFDRVLEIEAVIDPEMLNLEFYEHIEKLRPFGMGNSRPTFAIEKVLVENIATIGKDFNHRKLTLQTKEGRHMAVLFDYPSGNWQIESGDTIDVAFSLSLNEWNGRRKLDLIIEDAKKTK